jgi:solute:Na+ symporter, SSS family
MSVADWIVMLSTLFGIVAYGVWKTRKSTDIHGYLRGGNTMGWAAIGLSVMATQASAITFISTPGQAYENGMAFVQNYFGLPLALIIVSAVFIPIYYRLNVFTAYEYLEKRFDLNTRLLAAFLFLVQRGLAAGITIYAPAIILSAALGWNLTFTILFVGFLVIIYTVSGGTKAVSLTQKWQMGVIMAGMVIAFFTILSKFPEGVGMTEGLEIAGAMNRLNIVDFSFDLDVRYTFWSGITGGLFLALSYFGTDQSQVQRYLGGKSVKESRLGLMFNALLKIPMQFFILLCGIMVFVFFQFQQHQVLFDQASVNLIQNSEYAEEFQKVEDKHQANYIEKQNAIQGYLSAKEGDKEYEKSELLKYDDKEKEIRNEAKDVVRKAFPGNDAKDSDYVFLSFILNYLPKGLVGLLLAVIISAAMSSTSGELNALGTTTMIDFYKRLLKKKGSERYYVNASKIITAIWGFIAIGFALVANLLENLIEAVNILGSLFYGTILGIFIVAFFLRRVGAFAVFYAAIVAELLVIGVFFFYSDVIAYLWLNVIGCFLVILLSTLINNLRSFIRS